MNTKNVAIIGANGFMGGHLTRRFAAIPSVRLSLFGRSAISTFGNQYPYTQIDLTDCDQVAKSFAGIDVVYYLASASIPASSWNTPSVEIEQNLLPFINFMECIAPLGVKKVVFISSAGTIYGHSEEKADENSFKNPYSPHGITKLAMEYFLNYFKARYNIGFDIYRVSNVYGEGQDIKKGIGIINTFLENIILHSRLNIFGDGSNVRNYVYVRDFAELLALALLAGDDTSNVYNLSSHDTLSINELVAVMKTIVTEHFEVIYTPARQSDNPAIYLDNSRILLAHPSFAFTSIADGILKTYRHIKSIAATMV